jgi:two-component system, OmpR family, response regulator MprA
VRVLVVDDDRAVRDALRRALTLAGYEVAPAQDGEDALEQIAQVVPDAVVLDIGLPGVDGLEVCRRVRMLGNRVPILMLTARDAVSDRIDGLDVGADDYMVKPFDVGELKGAAARPAAAGQPGVRRRAPGVRRAGARCRAPRGAGR